MDVPEQTTGITGLRFAGRCKPIPESCGKNILFFTPVETQAQQSPAPVSRTASLRDSRVTPATITCSPQVNQRNDVAYRAQHAIASASRSVHHRDELVRSVGLTPYPFLGSSKIGLVACDERGLPWTGKPPAFCAMQDRRSAESFCRSIALRYPCSAQALGVHPWPPVERMRSTQGRIHAVPRNGYGVSLTSTRYSITIGACRD
jgi:hypothetical protein